MMVQVSCKGFRANVQRDLGCFSCSGKHSTSSGWGRSRGLGLVVVAIAQMGIHLASSQEITTGPDNTNNALALAFGIFIVFLVVSGSI